MARMIPAQPRTGCEHSEQLVHAALAAGLNDDFTVIQGARWLAPVKGRVESCEADFLVLHPEHGILDLEVKGGGIWRDPQSLKWFSRDARGQDFLLKPPPFEQAMGNAKKLLEIVKSSPRTAAIADRGLLDLAYAVVFPNCRTADVGLPTDLPRELVIDQDALGDIARRLLAIWRYHRGLPGGGPRATLGPVGVESVRELTAGAVSLPRHETRVLRRSLGEAAEQEEQAIERLTADQAQVVEAIFQYRRVLVTGCAGSGKTVVAMKLAELCASYGLDTLVVCFNKALAAHLKSRFEGNEKIEATHFHDLCQRWVARAGLSCPGPQEDSRIVPEDYYASTLPEAFARAIPLVPRRFQAILVDEGQDFRDIWWLAILDLSLNEDSKLFVFRDRGQAIYGGDADVLAFDQTLSLSTNLRNTKSIHSVLTRLRPEIGLVAAVGPPGRSPEIVVYDALDQVPVELSKVLHRLTATEKVRTSDIVVLTARRLQHTPLKDCRAGKFRLTTEPAANDSEVQTSTIHAFKGLESRVVILAGMEPDEKLTDELLYVGCSRARNHLVVICRAEIKSRFSGAAPTP